MQIDCVLSLLQSESLFEGIEMDVWCTYELRDCELWQNLKGNICFQNHCHMKQHLRHSMKDLPFVCRTSQHLKIIA